MSLDINELVRAVKQAAVEAVKADGPMAVSFGTVTSASPLKIQVDQKKTLTEAQLILTNNVRDFNVDMTVDHQTESQSGGSGEAALPPTSTPTRAGKPLRCTWPSRQGKRSSSSPAMAGKNTLSWTDGRHLDGNATDNWRKP